MKKLISVVLIVLTVACLTSGALAASEFGYLSDSAYVLSETEGAALADKAANISDKYSCGVYMVTIGDMRDFGYTDALEFAEAVYEKYDCGEGAGDDGILLVLSMENRDYGLVSHGEFANDAFTAYGKDVMSDEFCSYFADDDWYGGFMAYLRTADSMLQSAEDGDPVDMRGYGRDNSAVFGKLAVIIIVPSLIALVVCLVFKAQMKSVYAAADAAGYIPEKGVDIKVSRDVYTHTTESRRKLDSGGPGPRSHGGGGGGSGGFSGKSGKF